MLAAPLRRKKDAPKASMVISAKTIQTERMIIVALLRFCCGGGVNPGGIPYPCPFGDDCVAWYVVAVLLPLENDCICGACWPVPGYPFAIIKLPGFC